MNTYRITQITYAGYREHWIVKACRAPTANEVRERLGISIHDRILVAKIEFPTWDLPDNEWVPPPNLGDDIRKYLNLDAYHLRSLRERYGVEMVEKALRENS